MGGAGGAEPLRVLLIANTLPPADVSGVGEQVLQLAAGLRGEGCEVEVLGRAPTAGGEHARPSSPARTAPAARVSGGALEGRRPPAARAAQARQPVPGSPPEGAAGPKVLFPLTVVPAAWGALRRFRPHVVQVHESDGALAALLVRLLRRRLRPRPRLVALQQVSYAEERRAVRPLRAPDGRVLGRPGAVERRFRRGKGRLQVLLGRCTARLADLVLAPSAVTAAEIERDYGVAGVGVLPNVTGGLEVAGAEAPAPPAISEQNALLFVGRLRIRKGVEVLLEALALLPSPSSWGSAASGSTARLLIAGDGEHRPALEVRAAELALGDAVTFLGRCDAARVRALLSTSRALVVPSTYEGMPLVILEAMEAGVPVVASRVSGIPEVVADGETGWLVPAEDPAALAAALAEVLADPGEARRRGAAGRARLDERFRPAHAARRWLAVVGAAQSG